jgi:hypothetical protein
MVPALARAQTVHPDIEFVFVNQGESLEAVLAMQLERCCQVRH